MKVDIKTILSEDSVMKEGISRRAFMTGSAGVAAIASGVSPARVPPESAKPPGKGLRVAVLEYPDRWTKESIGAGKLLRHAGMTVFQLDITHPADSQHGGVDLIVFGSFVNNAESYRQYIQTHGKSLRSFVYAGGVVLEMTQSDQFGNSVAYLPKGFEVIRGDRDLNDGYPVDPKHPIINQWLGDHAGRFSKNDIDRGNVNWESVDRWEGMKVLLASEAHGGSPCLLEAAHGKGRFLVSGLWVDKCFDNSGKASVSDRALKHGKAFFAAVAGYTALVKNGKAPEVKPTPMPPEPPTGPMIGHTDTNRTRIWFRPSKADHKRLDWICKMTNEDGQVSKFETKLDPDHDFTAVVDVKGLSADSSYTFTIQPRGEGGYKALEGSFKTPPSNNKPTKVTLGMGSCAPSDPNRIWTQVIKEGCDGFIFLGDTPYVDTSNLGVARAKHREFLAQPEIHEMIKRVPCWGTWDDHDFGRNDGHGDFMGKHTCRTTFTEYRANATFGHDANGNMQTDRFGNGQGIYTSFRYGPIEFFLLDPRWFSRTEKSWADASQTTCLGKQQWQWFKKALLASKATFKCVTTGMIWDDKKNSEKDDWGTYHYERDAIFDFIKQENIPGCLLLGGDIHVSRALNYGPRVGYELWQFIISPMHHRVIPSLNVPHPNLVHAAAEPNVFLKMQIDTTITPATLKATWVNLDGKRIFEVKTDSDKLRA